LFLRSETHDGYDLAAWGVALHEAAHALQQGEEKGALEWRQTCISLSRYLPVAAAAAALSIVVFLKRPARFGLIIFAAACVVALLLNIGTLAIEFNANKRVLRSDHLEQEGSERPGAHQWRTGRTSSLAADIGGVPSAAVSLFSPMLGAFLPTATVNPGKSRPNPRRECRVPHEVPDGLRASTRVVVQVRLFFLRAAR
jgi:Zn-dependent membrane protease YugP